MSDIGRNQPCPCGSGKKYKKCCLRKDEDTRREEQEQRDFLDAVNQGLIDPMEGEEDWENDSELDRLTDWEEEDEDGWDSEADDDSDDDDWFDEEDSLPIGTTSSAISDLDLSDDDRKRIDEWWATYPAMEGGHQLITHITTFMDEYPALVKHLGLEVEPMYFADRYCAENNELHLYRDLLLRLRREFPEVYMNDFPRYDRFMVLWLLNEGEREQIPEYLENFQKNPTYDLMELNETVAALASGNCQGILTEFLAGMLIDESASLIELEADVVFSVLYTSIMAPFLDAGLESFDVEKLLEKLAPLSGVGSSFSHDAEVLQTRVERLLGETERWQREDCTTRFQAIRLYDEITFSFMGWLHRRKSLDWCASEYYRGKINTYLLQALPVKKRPRTLFPLHPFEIQVVLGRYEKSGLFATITEMFALLNGLYWFSQYLEETQDFAKEDAEETREGCREIFNRMIKGYYETEIEVQTWRQFPREP